MTSHGDFSPAARERAGRTAEVAAVFADQAEVIVAELPEVPEGHVLVAVVDAEHVFGGVHHVDRAELVQRVPELEPPGGWAMVFSAGTTVGEVRRRTKEMASIARQRVAAIDRIIARRGPS
jgi:hypothetical protein